MHVLGNKRSLQWVLRFILHLCHHLRCRRPTPWFLSKFSFGSTSHGFIFVIEFDVVAFPNSDCCVFALGQCRPYYTRRLCIVLVSVRFYYYCDCYIYIEFTNWKTGRTTSAPIHIILSSPSCLIRHVVRSAYFISFIC